MTLRLLADENIEGDLVRALVRQRPGIDILRVQDVGLSGKDDPTIIEWAAQEGRTIVTHDSNTLIGFAYQRVREGLPMRGVIAIPSELAIGRIATDMLALEDSMFSDDMTDQVLYLPLR